MSSKLKSFKPVIEELTVFIRVKIVSLKAFSILRPEIERMLVKITNEIIKTITVRKYL